MRWLFFLILFACSGPQVKEKKEKLNADTAPAKEEKLDFKGPPVLTYSWQTDSYQTLGAGGSALQQETAANDSARHKVLKKSQDPLERMIAACYTGDYSEGKKISDAIYRSHLNLPTYWNQVAICHTLEGNERKALLFFNKALELATEYSPALNNIGVVYQRLKQPQKALVAFVRAHKSQPKARTPRFNLAHLYLTYNLAGQALPLFKGLAQEHPADFEVQAGLAQAQLQLGLWQEAFKSFATLPEKLHARPDVAMGMAVAAKRLGRTSEAQAMLNELKPSPESRAYAEELKKWVAQ